MGLQLEVGYHYLVRHTFHYWSCKTKHWIILGSIFRTKQRCRSLGRVKKFNSFCNIISWRTHRTFIAEMFASCFICFLYVFFALSCLLPRVTQSYYRSQMFVARNVFLCEYLCLLLMSQQLGRNLKKPLQWQMDFMVAPVVSSFPAQSYVVSAVVFRS